VHVLAAAGEHQRQGQCRKRLEEPGRGNSRTCATT
jgi:hypothetical protein